MIAATWRRSTALCPSMTHPSRRPVETGVTDRPTEPASRQGEPGRSMTGEPSTIPVTGLLSG